MFYSAFYKQKLGVTLSKETHGSGRGSTIGARLLRSAIDVPAERHEFLLILLDHIRLPGRSPSELVNPLRFVEVCGVVNLHLFVSRLNLVFDGILRLGVDESLISVFAVVW